MTDTDFTPILYLKQNCPFCQKVRIALLETGQRDGIDIRDFAGGSPEEQAIRTVLEPHVAKISFPAAEIAPGRFLNESDEIVAWVGERAGQDPAALPVYRNYVDGPFTAMMSLWRENHELKAAKA